MRIMGRKDKGFTLAELLIVVATIGVLVAIAIPIFTGQLEKSREAVDAANIRSQYAEVISDALLDGTSVNGKEKYGAVQLKQKKDNWQNIELATNLHSVYAQVIGSPVVNGIAWVEYNDSAGQAILHYEGGTGNTTGGSTGEGSGNTGGGTTGGSSESAGTGSVLDDLKAGAGTWPVPGETGSIQAGHAYTLPDGSVYISTNTASYNNNNKAHYPTEPEWGWIGVRPSGTIISSDKVKDGKLTVNVNYGDIFQNPDGNLYIWKEKENPWGAPVNDGNWVKIVTE